MSSKVLTPLPNVGPRSGPGGLICAGHSVAPKDLPPGVMTVTCHRCGRPMVLGRTPLPQDGEPPTECVALPEPTQAMTGTLPGPTLRDETDAGIPPVPETREMAAVQLTSLDLEDIDATGGRTVSQSRLAPPVPEPEEATARMPPGTLARLAGKLSD